MAIYEDQQLTQSASKDDTRDFRIAWLNRRVENLEALVLEMLRGTVPNEGLDAYEKRLKEPGWYPGSLLMKDGAKSIVAEIRRGRDTSTAD